MEFSIGMVGLGQFGSVFAPLFQSHPLVDRIALCDNDPARIAQFADRASFQTKFHPRDIYESPDDICRSDLDALVIITQHGKHIYSAVPVISIPSGDETLDWCDKLVATCLRTGMSYMLGETTYYHADTIYCRCRAAEGAFGQIVHTAGEYLHSFDSPASDLRAVYAHRLAGKAGWEWQGKLSECRARGEQDSPMHYPTHSTSGPISVMGAHALKVSAWGAPPQTREGYFNDLLMPLSNITPLYQMSNGATMRIREHRECSLIRETFRVYGTQASYENGVWSEKERPTPLTEEIMRDPLPREVDEAFAQPGSEEGVYGGHGGSHAYLVHELVDAVAQSRLPAINA